MKLFYDPGFAAPLGKHIMPISKFGLVAAELARQFSDILIESPAPVTEADLLVHVVDASADTSLIAVQGPVSPGDPDRRAAGTGGVAEIPVVPRTFFERSSHQWRPVVCGRARAQGRLIRCAGKRVSSCFCGSWGGVLHIQRSRGGS